MICSALCTRSLASLEAASQVKNSAEKSYRKCTPTGTNMFCPDTLYAHTDTQTDRQRQGHSKARRSYPLYSIQVYGGADQYEYAKTPPRQASTALLNPKKGLCARPNRTDDSTPACRGPAEEQ